MKTRTHHAPAHASGTPHADHILRCRVFSLVVFAMLLLPACNKTPQPNTIASPLPASPAAAAAHSSVANPAPRREAATFTVFTPMTHLIARYKIAQREAAMQEASLRQQAQLNTQRAALFRAQQASEVARMNALRMQAEMQARAQAAGRQGAYRAQRNLNNHTGGYLGSLGL